MALCSSTTTSALPQFKPTPCTPSLSLSNPFFLQSNHTNTTHRFFTSHKLSTSSRQFSLLQPQSSRFSTAFAASASSAAVAHVEDKLPADILVTEKKEPNSRARLSVEVPPAVCEDCYKRIIKEFMKMSKVPGFRPGKEVPENILVGHVGRKNVRQATVESILDRTLPHAMSSVSGRALKDSVRIATKFSDMEETYSSRNLVSMMAFVLQIRSNKQFSALFRAFVGVVRADFDFCSRYDVIVDLAPEVRWIPEDGYKNLKVVVEIDSEIDAHKASEQELRRRHKFLGPMRIVTDRGLQVGDVAVLDISATTIDQDESNIKNIPSAESKEDGDKVLPGYLDSIIGIQQGETKSFPLVFPESWRQENLRGVHAQFTVECKELFYRDLPELDDSLADKLLPECTTLEQVKESLLQQFLKLEQTAKDQATDNAILDQLRKMVEVEIPQSMFEEQGRQLYGAKLLQVQANMKLNEQQLASLSSPRAVKEYLEDQREDIESIIRQNLAVGDIFKREDLLFSTEELVKEVENSIAEFKRQNQDYDEERVKEQFDHDEYDWLIISRVRLMQRIWDEVGESDEERDKMLFQIEQECLDVYKRKVDNAAKSRAELLQTLADANVELTSLLSALGEKTFTGIPEKTSGTIKKQLEAIAPALEQLWKQKDERIKEFFNVQSQIQRIAGEIAGTSEQVGSLVVDEADLTLKKLDEFQSQLQELQKEKSERLHKVLEFVSTVHDLCAVLGMDFLSTVTEVHPSLNDSTGVQSKSISNATLSSLAKTVLALKEDKKQRLHKLQELATQLIDLWNLMDAPHEERCLFDHVTCNISATVDEVTVPGALALDLIDQAEVEVERLDQLKASRMKEIAFKKQAELEEIYARAHIEIDSDDAREKIMALIDSGNVEPSELLADMDNQTVKAKEESLSRKDILDKVEKWMSACEEESWLEDYNRDENRYNASRGAHLNLKRAEKARVLVNKIPALVDTLVTKTRAWEEDRGITFSYDGVPLLAMLDEYAMLRHDREEEKRRMRDQKKFQEQANPEPEVFGSRPTPSPGRSSLGAKKVVGPRANGGGANGTPIKRLSLNQNGSRSINKDGKRDNNPRPIAPVNYVAMSKEDDASPISGTEPLPASP
ncbi:hypothetical protein RHSIM_Rhsim04G0016400 [Rhododendron simsii]|uniref:peptidylprolyl isomerase n=1 Tax=Rhododendron simsii TaxID=118357 RepID=A0A834HBB0_RHOSS|nr:hypothetical protein RHSIM_Rhsim04G0016400 [Rhododendron simsii]